MQSENDYYNMEDFSMKIYPCHWPTLQTLLTCIVWFVIADNVTLVALSVNFVSGPMASWETAVEYLLLKHTWSVRWSLTKA